MRKAKIAQNGRDWEARERAKDEEAFITFVRTKQAAVRAKYPEKYLAIKAKSLKTVLEDKRHYCDICDVALASPSALTSHLGTQAHKDAVAIANGAAKPQPSRSALCQRESNARILAGKRFFCVICNVNNPFQRDHNRHLGTKGHAKKLRLAAEAAAH